MDHSDEEPVDCMDLWHRQKELEMELRQACCDFYECARCRATTQNPYAFHFIEFMGGSQWECDDCHKGAA